MDVVGSDWHHYTTIQKQKKLSECDVKKENSLTPPRHTRDRHVAKKKRETMETATTARLRWPRMGMEESTEQEGKLFANRPVRYSHNTKLAWIPCKCNVSGQQAETRMHGR